jgi:hypothetical protein
MNKAEERTKKRKEYIYETTYENFRLSQEADIERDFLTGNIDSLEYVNRKRVLKSNLEAMRKTLRR